MENKNKISALINLLDDPDDEIYYQVKEQLLLLGSEAIPDLEQAWETSFGTLMQNRIEELIHSIQFNQIKQQLRNWAKSDNQNLFNGALIIARYQYPDLNEIKIKSYLDQIRQDIWLELNPNLTALEIAKVINHIFFEVHGFSGNTSNFHAPQNSYINNVIESKKGNPLSLSILYSEIAAQLNLPVYGVNLPQHFILAYVNRMGYYPLPDPNYEHEVLFYINAFSRGAIFSRKDVEAYLKQLNLPNLSGYFNPCSPVDMIKRLIHNLINGYEKLGYPDKVNDMNALLEAIEIN
jgi:regulator of sirC expression with transglutaminase-like and TPR domain